MVKMANFAFDRMKTLWERRKYCLPEYSPFPSMFNSLPHDKILDLSKLKAFADNKINVT